MAALACPETIYDPADERLDRIRLFRTATVGPVGFRHLLERYDSAGAALDALPGLARQGGRLAPLRIPSRSQAERECAAADAAGGATLVWGDPDYPPPLAEIPDAPPVFTVLGDPGLLRRRAVAMVGARNASTNGRGLARALAASLADAGLVVVSGLARGIDTAAHEGALDTGRTVAVLAGGVDVPYPPQNQDLYRRIAETGAVVSEMPHGTEPRAGHFPRRNRIISGLSMGVLVVEAALRSGSLITARLAGEQGREVMAVPGPPTDPRARGANDLLRQGAALVETAADVFDALAAPVPPSALDEEPPPAADAGCSDHEIGGARAALVAVLGPTPVPVDALVRDLNLPPAAVRGALLELEIAGQLERQTGGRVCLIGATGY